MALSCKFTCIFYIWPSFVVRTCRGCTNVSSTDSPGVIEGVHACTMEGRECERLPRRAKINEKEISHGSKT